MLRIFGDRAVLPMNTLLTVFIVGYLGFHTLLFTHVSNRLDKALKRVDELELLLMEKMSKADFHTKEMALTELRRGLDMGQVSQTETRDMLRVPRSINTEVKPRRLGTRIQHMKKKLKKCRERIQTIRKRVDCLNRTRTTNPEDKPYPRRFQRRAEVPRRLRNRRKRVSTSHVLYTIWGSEKCYRRSRTVEKGQMVTVDGSDFMCLPDDSPFRGSYTQNKEKGRPIGGYVDIRGVTYGDIEYIMSRKTNSPLGGRNNKTVPCAICSRPDKSSSMMVLSLSLRHIRNFRHQSEYFGVLMAARGSKQAICVTLGPAAYRGKGKNITTLKDTVQLHAAKLDCDSVHCNANDAYPKIDQVPCVVITV